ETRVSPIPNPESRSSSLFLGRERPVAEAGYRDLPLHGVLVLGGAGVGALEDIALHVHGELEADVLPLDAAGEIGLAELTRVMAGQLLAVLLQRDRRRARARRRLDGERPLAGDVHLRRLSGGCRR